MSSLTVTDFKFTDLLSQAFFNVHSVLLQILKEALENSLIQLRDEVIGAKAYHRGMRYKRWGYTIRKWIQTPIGLLKQVRIPRVRSAHNEIRLFIDRFSRRSIELEEILLEGYLWGMSSRRLSVLMKRLFKDSLSATSICKLKQKVREGIERYRSQSIHTDIVALVVDGVWIKYRSAGKGVILAALGITAQGQVIFLDWQVSDSESTSAWLRLFKTLVSRGLKTPEVIVSEDAPAINKPWAIFAKEFLSHPDNFNKVLGSSDLVISHQGLTTLFQAICNKVPIISNIPPKGKYHSGKYHTSFYEIKTFEKLGLCRAIFRNLPYTYLMKEVKNLLDNKKIVNEMKRNQEKIFKEGEKTALEEILNLQKKINL